MLLSGIGASGIKIDLVRLGWIIALTLWMTGFLCLLNIALAIVFRKRRKVEILSYYLVCGLELVVFVFALLLYLGIVTQVPFQLPPGLPIDRAEIGATIAFGIGLAPAAYWHRINISELPQRIAQDAVVMKERDAGVRVRKDAPGEWMN